MNTAGTLFKCDESENNWILESENNWILYLVVDCYMLHLNVASNCGRLAFLKFICLCQFSKSNLNMIIFRKYFDINRII